MFCVVSCHLQGCGKLLKWPTAYFLLAIANQTAPAASLFEEALAAPKP